MPTLTKCERCNYVSSQKLCKACTLLEGLNRGLPKLGIGKSSRVKRLLAENDEKTNNCKSNSGECSCKNNKETKQISLEETRKLIQQLNM